MRDVYRLSKAAKSLVRSVKLPNHISCQCDTDGFFALESRNIRVRSKIRSKVQIADHPANGSFDLASLYELPWLDLTQMLNGSGDNQNGKYKSSNLKANYIINEATQMYNFLVNSDTENPTPATADGSQTLIQVDSYGGQINYAGQGNTMVAARGSNLKTQYQTYWKNYEGDDPELQQSEIINWINSAYLKIHIGGGTTDGIPDWGDRYQGCYFNYPDIQLGTNIGFPSEDSDGATTNFLVTYFGKDTAAVLRELKSELDPSDVLRFAQSCQLPDPV